MGMAASQVRFLQLTSRKADIGRELQHLSNQKMALTRDMHVVSQNYQQALRSKTLKWSNNAGVTCSDLSYSTLMRPNNANPKQPILITNSIGKIILDSKYKKYAEELDQAGGKWSGSIRTKILAELTGISEQSIADADSTKAARNDAVDADNKTKANLELWKSKEEEKKAGTKYLKEEDFAKYMGSYNGNDLANLYSKGENGNYSFSSASDIKSLINGIKNNMSKYFVDDDKYLKVSDKTEFTKACDKVAKTYESLLADPSNDAKALEPFGIKDSSVNIKELFGQILGAYYAGEGSYEYNNNDEKTVPLRDTTTSAWQNWYNELKVRQEAYETANTEFKSSVDTANQVLTADKETAIAYYDSLFQAIADNGWSYDAGVEEGDYLNQMFQNNQYYLTTMTKNNENNNYDYEMSLASNFDNLYVVNDSDARDEALVEYEYQKSLINEKESRIDRRMKNLETEQSAISKMLESIDQVKKDNIERTYGIWA